MGFFPQMHSGALAQYPLSRRTVYRTAMNAHADGRVIKFGDPDWKHTVWQLTYTGLTDEEKDSLAGLFEEVEGRLGAFTFLDPWGNLLGWSEDPGNGIWNKDPLVEWRSWAADPFGGTAGTTLTNTGTGRLGIRQSVPVPAAYQHCFSVYVRAAQECDCVLYRSGGGERIERRFRVGPAWRRLQHSAACGSAAVTTDFGLELDGGCEMTVFGFQLEAQASAGAYRKTTTDTGVYTDAHFDQDVLELLAEGVGRHGTSVRVRARREAGD